MRSSVRRVHRAVWVLALALLVGAGLLLALDVQAVRHDLEAGRAQAVSAREAIAEGDLRTAADALRAAGVRLDDAAERRSSGPWRAAGRVPVAGPAFRAVDSTSEAATAAVDLGHAVLDAVMDAQARGATAGRLPLDAVRDLDEILDGPAMDALVETTTALREPAHGWVPGAVRSAQQEMLVVADDVLATLRPIRAATSALPGFLGADEPRRYLVAMQNGAELRGTGGLIGFHALLTADAGQLDFTKPEVDGTLDPRGAAIETDKAFRDRYGGLGATSGLLNANLHPDFPTTARVLVGLHEAARGQAIDGVIAVDVTAVAGLLAGGKPLTVPRPEGDSSGQLPSQVSPEALPQLLLVDAYERLGGATEQRKDYHAAVAEAAFDRLRHLRLTRGTLERMAELVAGRHIQVYSVRPDEQRAFERLGAAGRLEADIGQDLLAVTANNAGGTKQDVHVRHRLSARLLLSPVVTDGGGVRLDRQVDLRVAVDNPLPRHGRDPYILGTAIEGGRQPPELAGTNRTWFTIWMPGSSRPSHGRGQDGPLHVSSARYHHLRAVDHLLDTPPESRAGYEVAYAGPVPVQQQDGRLVYRLLLWRQAKAIADHLDMIVTAAEGWRVVDGTVRGPADAGRLGFGEETVPLQISLADGGARIVGTATGDVELTIELREQRTPDAIGEE